MSKRAEQLKGIGKYLVVLIVIAFISTLFPNNARFKYQFERGATWSYDDLVAPFNFPIKKSDEEIALDRTARQAALTPFYEMNLEVAKQQKRAFEENFKAQLEAERANSQFEEVFKQPNRYINYGWRLLDRIYNRGVILLNSKHKGQGNDFVVNVVRGDEIQLQTLGNLLSLDDASNMLSDSLPYSSLREPEFLLPILEQSITHNVQYSQSRTEQLQEDIPETKGQVEKGELIVTEEGIITDDIYEKLVSFRDAYEVEITKQRSSVGIFIGYFLLTSLIIGVFLLYIQQFSKDQLKQFNRFVFIFIWFVIYSYLVYIVESINALSAYMLPFCIVPIVVKHFYDSRLALFTHIIVILIASFLSSLGYEFTFVQIIAGIVAVLGNVNSRDLTQFFYSIGLIFVAYLLTFVGLRLIQEGTLDQFNYRIIAGILVNVFLILLAQPLIPLLGRIFGFTSASTLLELEDLNKPLLRKLATTAPGTFQHSLQVANLAEEAARAVGADHLLVKVAALYHDIGKTLQPTYFIENQNGENPHKQLTPLESAKIIIDHVVEGEKMAKKSRLPKVVTNFITTHHGTTRVEYFYRKHLEANPESGEEAVFRYPGPKPTSKEQSILMIADSVEAACKSLKNPTGKDIDDMIEKIINGKLKSGQLEHSALTFGDLEACRVVFKNMLRSIHHVRVEYPKEQEVKKLE